MLCCGAVKGRRILSDVDVKQHNADQSGWSAEPLFQVKLCVAGGKVWAGWPCQRCTQGDDNK